MSRNLAAHTNLALTVLALRKIRIGFVVCVGPILAFYLDWICSVVRLIVLLLA